MDIRYSCNQKDFKQKTAYEIVIGDWSSDVCSSDLLALDAAGTVAASQLLDLGDGHHVVDRKSVV